MKEIEKLLEEIKSDKYIWKGWKNGDDETIYQAKKCEQMSLILKLMSIIMVKNDVNSLSIDTLKELQDLYFEYIRNLDKHFEGSMSGFIRFDRIPLIFRNKVMNIEDLRQLELLEK